MLCLLMIGTMNVLRNLMNIRNISELLKQIWNVAGMRFGRNLKLEE